MYTKHYCGKKKHKPLWHLRGFLWIFYRPQGRPLVFPQDWEVSQVGAWRHRQNSDQKLCAQVSNIEVKTKVQQAVPKSRRTRQTQVWKDFKPFCFGGLRLVRVNTGVRSGISHLRVAGGGPSFFSTMAGRDSWSIDSETELCIIASAGGAEFCLTVFAGSRGARDFFADLTLDSVRSLSSMSSSNGFKLRVPAACLRSPRVLSTTDGAVLALSVALLSANVGLDGAGPLPCLASVTGPLTESPSLTSGRRCGETLSVLTSWDWWTAGGWGAARFSRWLLARSLWWEEVVALPGDNGPVWLLEKRRRDRRHFSWLKYFAKKKKKKK